MKKHDINVPEFTKSKRDDASISDVEDAMRQLMSRPSKPRKKSENREPTKQEIQKRWKLER